MTVSNWTLTIDKNTVPIQWGVDANGNAVSFSVNSDWSLNVTDASSTGTTNTPATSVVGGSTTYSNAYGDFQVTVAGWNKEVVVSWLPFTLTAETIMWGSAKVQDATGTVSTIPMTAFTLSSSTITFTDKTDVFVAGDVVSLYLTYQQKAFDPSPNALLTENLNPDYANRLPQPQFIDETNIVADTYYKQFLSNNYNHFNLDISVSGGVTVSIFWSSSDNTIDTSDSGWQDLSWRFTPIVDDVDAFIDNEWGGLGFTKYLVKYVTTDATNSIDMSLNQR